MIANEHTHLLTISSPLCSYIPSTTAGLYYYHSGFASNYLPYDAAKGSNLDKGLDSFN